MSSIKKTAIIITIVALLSKLLGFGRQIVFAYFFGTSFTVDAYLMASDIPIILFGWLTAVSISFVPLYTNVRGEKGIKESQRFTENILSIVFILSIFCLTFGLLFSRQIVSVVAHGFEKNVYELTVKYFRVAVFTVLFHAPIQILIAYLNCNNRFIQSNLSNLVVSSTQIVVIFLAGIFDSSILIFGVLLSEFLQFILVYMFSRKNDNLQFNFSITPDIKKLVIITIPIFVSSIIDQLNIFIDKSFASGLGEGSISALNYGTILRTFIFTIFTIAITTMIYPMLSQAVTEKNMDKVKELFSRGTNIILILFIPITVGAVLLAKPAIIFVYQRGQFDATSTAMTISAFVMYSIGLLAIALRDVITRVFYSMQDTRSTLYIGSFTVLLNIIFNVILVKRMGLAGLALGTSLSSIISIPLFFIVLRKKLGSLGLKNTLILFIKAAISATVMGIVVYYGYRYLSLSLGTGKMALLVSILTSALAGAIVYFILMLVLRVKEMDFFTDIFKKVLSKIKR